MILYHGSNHIIEMPTLGGGKRTNDYGPGFYTTESLELAKEWACAMNTDGFANCYTFDPKGLKILNLNDSPHSILNWLAMLAHFRTYWQKGSIAEQAKKYIHKNFFIDPNPYDVIIGYRADDSYFSFAQDFVAGTISLQKLSEAMHLGKLGEQIVIKSEAAYARLRFLEAVPADATRCYKQKADRDLTARREYRKIRSSEESLSDLFILDIMREEMKTDDPRLR